MALRKRIGVMVPSTNTTFEADFQLVAPRDFAARRVSVATPYPDWNNQRLRAYLEASGFEVLNVEGEPTAAASGNQGINDHDPEEVVAFASRVCRPDADALLCSCTAWRS